jgi:hypothetical protein
LGCSTRASDAGDFAEKQLENACYITKKCEKWTWNSNEWKNIQDCVDEFVDNSGADDIEEYGDYFDESCPDFDKDMANDCLSQMVKEYNTCTPAHDTDDADFDCEDDPCRNICGDCSGGDQWGDTIPNPWAMKSEL